MKYITKSFKDIKKLDEWLNSFKKDKPRSEYDYKIVGYVAVNNQIVVTLMVFDASIKAEEYTKTFLDYLKN
jgi:hypothetical protein